MLSRALRRLGGPTPRRRCRLIGGLSHLAYGLIIMSVWGLRLFGQPTHGLLTLEGAVLYGPFLVVATLAYLLQDQLPDGAADDRETEAWFVAVHGPGRSDHRRAEWALGRVREAVGVRTDAPVMWLRSPLEVAIAIRLFDLEDHSLLDLAGAATMVRGAVPPAFDAADWGARVDTVVAELRRHPRIDDSSHATFDLDKITKVDSDRGSLWTFDRRVQVDDRVRSASLGDETLSKGIRPPVGSVWYRIAVARQLHRTAGHRLSPLAGGLIDVLEASGGLFLDPRISILMERPLEVHRIGGSGALHRPDGPAEVYADGWAVWALDGVGLSQTAVEAPALLSPGEIARAPIEQSRIMRERFGIERYRAALVAEPGLISSEPVSETARAALAAVGLDRVMRAAGTIIHEDLDLLGAPRRLWRAELRSQAEALVAVEVRNSTAGPDGTYRAYFLRVPPATRTCREAVAWTFRMAADEYETVFES